MCSYSAFICYCLTLIGLKLKGRDLYSIHFLPYLILGIMPIIGISKACEQTLSIGVGTSWPPYYFEGKNNLIGIDVEIVETLFLELNICPRYIKMPSSVRGLTELEKGNVDVLYAASFTKERAVIGIFSEPYRQENVRIFWRPPQNNTIKYKDLMALLTANLVGTINPGSYFGPIYDKSLKTNNSWPLVYAPSIEQRMGMVDHNRVTFSIEDEIAGLYFLAQNKIKNIQLHPSSVYENQVSLLFSRKTVSQKQVTAINKVIINSQDKIKHIINSYTGDLKTPHLIPK